MKRFLCFISLCLFSYAASSQVPSFGKWKIEGGFAEAFSGHYSVGQYSEAYNAGNCRWYVETRYHFLDKIAIGVQASYYGHDKMILPNEGVYGVGSGIIRNSQFALMSVVDWIVLESRRVSPFCGFETGWSFVGKSSSVTVEKDSYFVLNPHLGFEFYKHFRIGFEYFHTAGDRDNSFFAIRVGVCL